jgi:hypothetical protein
MIPTHILHNLYTVNMKTPRTYQNGLTVTDAGADFRTAKVLLLKKGIYQRMDNFGPYNSEKSRRIVKVVDVFVLEGMEFTIVESDVIPFSPMSVSAPGVQREAWFQPLHNLPQNC